MEPSVKKSCLSRLLIMKPVGLLFCGLVICSALSGCATSHLTQWQCTAIGAGAGAGAGIGTAINENTGDHENSSILA